MTTKPNKPNKKRKNIIIVVIVMAVLFAAGAYAYTKATDIVAETLVTKIASANTPDSSSAAGTGTTTAQNIYKKMSGSDQEKVKEIVSKHMTATNIKKVTEYLGNNDVAGLKEYAYENLSATEITQLKDLYDKYN